MTRCLSRGTSARPFSKNGRRKQRDSLQEVSQLVVIVTSSVGAGDKKLSQLPTFRAFDPPLSRQWHCARAAANAYEQRPGRPRRSQQRRGTLEA